MTSRIGDSKTIDARARAHLGSKGLLRCRTCGSSKVSVHDQGTLGVLVMCQAEGCLGVHTVFQS
ncbi:hypothetical protein J7W19_01415 [Streptomyces mobaraensis NBRC 13819 = DSM 40847]|uniref:Uncharacterized protein n=2 Tax=Streptomyces mobaraensis TaxID=35621 RepID=A0A5N5W790_STRMB|nr:hypothetical protein [Streptomyces mobaraensis]EMF01130.1 hypothetical protein H340_07498 [Streptomyces mobaraensis NBRC 13819 = DSM 40847]KAB7843779.1 hypothetical protein FRZ00_17715 [Streptomyces mobaraensis]QTT72263.1 hypothetical protein J7W19_01415 [Streptomyces mobaraensis NBRC 13819 = DSM 40847]